MRYVRSRFEDMPPRVRASIEQGRGGLALEDCTVAYLTVEEWRARSRKKRPLTDINPAWKE